MPWRICTSRRFRRERSSTRACSPPSSCAASSPSCPTSAWRARSPSCTRASRPTPFRPGRSPIPTGCWRTTARSTPWQATATGCTHGSRCLKSDLIPGELSRIFPVVTPGASDSASFDETLELLHLGGREIAHAVLMMIPEAWEGNGELDEARRAFYRYHGCLMEPWDGPAVVAFTDGTRIGAVLDRNGLRPGRYWVTADGLVVLASEVGVLDLEPSRIVRKGRLQPGRMFLVDTAAGRIVEDDELKARLAAEHPYQDWLKALVGIDELPPRRMLTPQHASVVRHQRLFGVTAEELRLIVAPMARTGAEPLGSMGSDTPIAVLSERPRLLFDYFSQLFAQVTNPPLDAIREELVTSLATSIGPERNLLEPGPESCRQISLHFPVIDNDELAKLVYVNEHGETPGFKAFTIDGLFEVGGGGAALERALQEVCDKVTAAIEQGAANIIVLSDRNSSARAGPDPVAPAHLGGAPPPRARARADAHGARRRDGRGARGAPLRAARRLRRRGGQPVPRARVRRRHGARRRAGRPERAQGGPQLREGSRQGRAQGDVEDGHLDDRLLHRRAGLRGGRARRGRDRALLRRNHEPSRGRGARRARRGGGTPPRPGLGGARRRAGPSRDRGRRRVPVAARGRASPVQPDARCSSCSTPRGRAATTSSRSTPASSTTRPSGWRPCAACSDCAALRAVRTARARPSPPRAGRLRRLCPCDSRRSSRRARS